MLCKAAFHLPPPHAVPRERERETVRHLSLSLSLSYRCTANVPLHFSSALCLFPDTFHPLLSLFFLSMGPEAPWVHALKHSFSAGHAPDQRGSSTQPNKDVVILINYRKRPRGTSCTCSFWALWLGGAASTTQRRSTRGAGPRSCRPCSSATGGRALRAPVPARPPSGRGTGGYEAKSG